MFNPLTTIMILKVVCFTQVTSFQISTLTLKNEAKITEQTEAANAATVTSAAYSVMWIYLFSFYGIVHSWIEDRSGLCVVAGVKFQCSKIWRMQSDQATQHNTLSRPLFKHEDS